MRQHQFNFVHAGCLDLSPVYFSENSLKVFVPA